MPDITEKENRENGDNQDRVVSLFQFIKELNKLKQKSILSIDDYAWSRRIADIPDDPENISVYWRDCVSEYDFSEEEITEEDSILLSVHKPEFEKCPEPDADFAEWLQEGWDDFTSESVVKDKLDAGESEEDENDENENAIEEEIVTGFYDDSERVRKYNKWLIKREKWAEKQKKIQKTRLLFAELYLYYFELERDSETEEIIAADGMLLDRDNPSLKHPVLTHRVKLDYDSDENTVYVRDTELPSELYSVVFQNTQDINLSGINSLTQELEQKDYHPLDRNDTPIFFKNLIHQLSSDSIYSEGIPENWAHSSRLLLYRDPCYILRKRLDGTPKAIEQIIENVRETGEIPAPIEDIVSGGKIEIPEDAGDMPIEEQLAAVGGESADILLSKEANKEQLEIAKRIEYYNAVLVQGPPGTGKTHTIANLLGHFLAQGKSVLVTSYTRKALSVLKDKVAPGLQSLCVSLLDDSNVDMEKSVDGITGYMSKTTSFELKKEMDSLAAERETVIKKLADVRRKIFWIINQENSCIAYEGEEISPSKAADFVMGHERDLSYIPGTVRCPAPLPLTFDELAELYRSNEGITREDEEELSSDLPDPASVMLPSDLKETLAELETVDEEIAELSEKSGILCSFSDGDNSLTFRGGFGSFIMEVPSEESIADLKEYVNHFGKKEEWMKAAAVDGKNGGAFRKCWLTLTEQIRATCEAAETVVTEQFGVELCISDAVKSADLKNAYLEMKPIFAEKGKISSLTLLLHKNYKQALDAVTINGAAPKSADDCELVLHSLKLTRMRRICSVYWDELLKNHGVPGFYQLDEQYPERMAAKWVPLIEKYLDWYQSELQTLNRKLTAAGFPAETIYGIDILDSDLACLGQDPFRGGKDDTGAL